MTKKYLPAPGWIYPQISAIIYFISRQLEKLAASIPLRQLSHSPIGSTRDLPCLKSKTINPDPSQKIGAGASHGKAPLALQALAEFPLA